MKTKNQLINELNHLRITLKIIKRKGGEVDDI